MSLLFLYRTKKDEWQSRDNVKDNGNGIPQNISR